MAKKQQTIEIPKAVPKKRKASKPKKPSAIAIPKASTTIKKAKPKAKNNKKIERPAKTYSSGNMQNNSLADAFEKAGITIDSFKI